MAMHAFRTNRGATDSHVSMWSCFHCRRRKVRCDRQDPCFHCVKGGLDCSFPLSGRVPTRQHDSRLAERSRGKQSELVDRLRQLERVVADLSSQLDETRSASNSPQLVRRGDDPALTEMLGTLLTNQDGSFYVGNRLLEAICSEVTQIREGLENTPDEESNSEYDVLFEQHPATDSFFWGNISSTQQSLQPLPSQMPYIWQVFMENIDPFVKVLHIPTITKILRETKGRFSQMAPDIQALAFAISLAAITSLSDEEVAENFNDDRNLLVARLTTGTEQALSQAGLLGTTQLTLVQAFIIYLEVVECKERMRPTWILGGMLYRVALSMGLHRDGKHFPNVNPYQAEMRRRVWWHVCINDFRTGDCQLAEASFPESSFDTSEPSHLNDTDLSPSILELPVARDDFSDATPTAVRCEVWRVNRRLRRLMSVRVPEPPQAECYMASLHQVLNDSKEKILFMLDKRLEPSNALHNYLHTLISLNQAEYKLAFSRHSKDIIEATEEQAQKDLLLGLACLDVARRLKSGIQYPRWNWMFRFYVPWHAMSVVLVQLIKMAWGPTCERAWQMTKNEYESIPPTKRGDPITEPLRELIADVGKYREKEVQRLRADKGLLLQLSCFANLNIPASELYEIGSGRLGFDTSAGEERLMMETNVSKGKTVSPIAATVRSVNKDEAWISLDMSPFELFPAAPSATGSSLGQGSSSEIEVGMQDLGLLTTEWFETLLDDNLDKDYSDDYMNWL